MSTATNPVVKIVKFFELIKFSHTVFALPFAFISAILAIRTLQIPSFSGEALITLGWIALAMVGARSGAMGFNRLVDLKWDAENPRTAIRPSATGEISKFSMGLMILLSFALLVFAAWNLNSMAFKLSPVAIFLVSFYSYTKRFTSYSHLFLGLAIGAAPVAACIAVTGTVSFSSLLLGFSVLLWIAGFDILYALQDLDFDKKAGLYSIPVRFGVATSLRLAKVMHLIALHCWIAVKFIEDLNWIFSAGVMASGLLLIWEHRLIKKDDLSKLNMAFFNMNALISVTLFVALFIDLLVFN